MRRARHAWCWVVTAALEFAGIAHAADTAGPAEGCTEHSAETSFWHRLRESYATHLAWDGADPAVPAATAVNGAPLPESTPPFPYAAWNVGGTPTIGVENMSYSALMDALYCGPHGKAWKDSRFTIYGWLEPGGNLSTSHSDFNYRTGTGGNAPAGYAFEPNTVQLDQVTLYLERTPDEVQRDHIDWGFRVTGLYGTDYKYTFSDGLLDSQYTQQAKRYGFDPAMYYVDLWFPAVLAGLNVRMGRYLSIPDIESQPAPNSLTYTHSLLYVYDPFTTTGILGTLKFDRNWQLQTALSDGSDVAPWVKSERHLTPGACLVWTSNSGKDELYPCMNGLNDGHWRWDNVQHAVMSWYHKFSPQWHIATEAWYMWQSHTPNLNNPDGLAALQSRYANTPFDQPGGAFCSPLVVYCYSYEWALVNYINYQAGPRDMFVWRSDFLNDARGQRTGFKSRYYEFDLSYTHWIGDVIELRPEARFEHAIEADAYDNPTAQPGDGKHSQAMLAVDAILHF